MEIDLKQIDFSQKYEILKEKKSHKARLNLEINEKKDTLIFKFDTVNENDVLEFEKCVILSSKNIIPNITTKELLEREEVTKNNEYLEYEKKYGDFGADNQFFYEKNKGKAIISEIYINYDEIKNYGGKGQFFYLLIKDMKIIFEMSPSYSAVYLCKYETDNEYSKLFPEELELYEK